MRQPELTGRTVLIALLGFFAVVGGANAVLVYAATSTFGGVEVASSYKAGLKFQDELAAVRAQDALHWQVDAKLDHRADGAAEVTVSLRQPNGFPVTAVDVAARLAHPADARRDHAVDMRAAGAGLFKGVSDAELTSQWDLVIDVTREGRNLFRSKSRVGLK